MEYILLSDSLMKKDGLKFRPSRRLTSYKTFKGFPIGDMLLPSNRVICRLNLPELLAMLSQIDGNLVDEHPIKF